MKPLKVSESVFKNAEFIWIRSMDEVKNAYVDFHEKLTKKAGAKYHLYIIADQNYALYVNGKYCEGFQFAGLPEKDYNVYDEYDVTDFLADGENEIKIAAYAQNEGSYGYSKGKNGVMYVFTEDGEPIVMSNLQTKANKNPNYTSGPVTAISPQISFTFDYDFHDAEVEPGEVFVSHKFDVLYSRPVVKHKIREKCDTIPVVWGSFIDQNPADHPGRRMQLAYTGFSGRLRQGENRTENGVLLEKNENTDGVYVIYDMGGEEEIGYITVDITLPEDAEFMVGWGEHIDDLRVRTSTCTWNNSCYAASFKGKAGRNTFMHPFKRLGGRYLSLQVYSPSVEVHYVGVTPTFYPTARDVKFTCADNLHNLIYKVAKRSMHLCMLDRHSCDTLREQGNYGLDTRIYAMGTNNAFGDFEMTKNSIRLFSMTLRGDNMLEMCAPGYTDLCIPTYTCSFMDLVWECLLYSGDYDFAREMVPVCEKICTGLLERTDDRGLIPRFHSTDKYNYWNFHEWNPGLDGGHDFYYALPTNAAISIAYRSLAKTYEALGEKENAERWFAASDELNKACYAAFYDKEKAYFYSKIGEHEDDKFGPCHFLAQFPTSLAIYAGMCPESELDRAIDVLVNDPDHIPSQLSFSIYRYDVMMMRPEKYGRVLFGEIADKYGYMLRHNAATFWETFRGGDDFGYAANMVQGWSGVPAYLYLRYAAGITPVAPGVFEKHPLPVEYTGIYEVNVEGALI